MHQSDLVQTFACGSLLRNIHMSFKFLKWLSSNYTKKTPSSHENDHVLKKLYRNVETKKNMMSINLFPLL